MPLNKEETPMETELHHHGIKGQKWGIRRYRSVDGRLTPAGKKRYSSDNKVENTERAKKIAKTIAGAAVGIGVSYAGAKFAASPAARTAVGKVLDKLGSMKVKDVKQNMDSLTDIYSKTLGRNFTVAEAIAEGLSDFI
jgi:hypothetical protein